MDPTGPIGTFLEYLDKGGFVMPPLVIATLILWYALGYRYMVLQRGRSGSLRSLIEGYETGKLRDSRGLVDRAAHVCVQAARSATAPARAFFDDACAEVDMDLTKGRILIKSIVTAAPLAGLLGTVTGMIETFDSLADMSLYSQSGGIAGGISQALFTTQMGLAVAVPGVVLGRVLDRRQTTLQDEVSRIKDLLSAQAHGQG
jgi:biopolymer transport protein ExbB